MAGFTNQEKADLHFMYDVADGNALEAQKLYRESFSTRCFPDEKIFQQLCTGACVKRAPVSVACKSKILGMADDRSARTPEGMMGILNRVEDHPESSTRAVSCAVNIFQLSVWKILLRNKELHPYHVQKVQTLLPYQVD